MANVVKMQTNDDSEMEEGEIVDELDDLSDISSEEEFLLRQRLEVLEDYNNALGRTKKKRSSVKPTRNLICDLSEISATETDESKHYGIHYPVKVSKTVKQHIKSKRRKEPVHKNIEPAYVKRKKDHRKKTNYTRKKLNVKVVQESSDESEDEYRNKRRKLADAVVGHRGKTDTSSLSARLKKMLYKPDNMPTETDVLRLKKMLYKPNIPTETDVLRLKKLFHKPENIPLETEVLNIYLNNNQADSTQLKITPPVLDSLDEVDCGKLNKSTPKDTVMEKTQLEAIELFTSDDDDDVKVITNDDQKPTVIENVINDPKSTTPEHNSHEAERDSDEDLAQLREQVLSTKPCKSHKPQKPESKMPSEDEDSDTAELRLICLKSTLLKRAIEIKQKQKMQKRLSLSNTLEDDIFFPSKNESGNNTDIESMDMDMGSDLDEKVKDGKDERLKKTEADKQNANNHASAIASDKEEEEDEDLLRAKLLTSLSKNLPNLVSPELLNTIDEIQVAKPTVVESKPVKLPEQKRFIIKLDESDSEGEHEATKNLTKMHMKLSEQTDFQQKLDLFLKSTRMQVENTKLPDVVQKQTTPKKPEKFVAKAVNHLPKSEQIEYKNLVKRMAELEKMKQLRQASINSATQPLKETLKPRNATIDINLEEKITISRKKIADESAKMLKLKEEATKLTQKFKIVKNELHNISTAINLNKRQQRAVQNCLSKIRQQHQSLIKSSSSFLHSKVNGNFNRFTNKVATKLQKENNPKDEYKNIEAQKAVKISVANELNKATNPKLSIEFNVANNVKVVKMPSPVKEKRVIEITETPGKELMDETERLNPSKEGCENIPSHKEDENLEHIKANNNELYTVDDYKSPLDAFGDTSWKSDPNAILCPFDVGGQCKDADCKYLHTQLSEQ